jgi:hypothetical protein
MSKIRKEKKKKKTWVILTCNVCSQRLRGYGGGGGLLPIHNSWIIVRAMLGTV